LLFLTGCGGMTNSNNELKIKVIEEINYLDNKILSIVNSLNGIILENYKIETREIQSSELQSTQKQDSAQNSSSESNNSGDNSSKENNEEPIILSEMKTTSILTTEDDKIDWPDIKFEIELLHNTWATIVVDLYKLNVPGDIINDFSNTLNIATISIKNEDISNSTDSLSTLYSYLPRFLTYATDKKEDINLKDTKSYILTAFYNSVVNNWNNVSSYINYAIESYTPILNNLEYTKGKEHATNRIYILLNEIKNSVTTNDKDIFIINYKNIINELNIL